MAPKITKLYVERGKTVQIDDKTWNKKLFGLEADVSDIQNEDKLEKLRQDLWDKEGDWIEEESTTVAKPTPISIDDIPDIDITEVNDCAWTKYGKEKIPAKPGEAAWIKNPLEFASETFPKVLSQLVKLIRKSPNGKLILGDNEYSLSGKGDAKDRFISRKPRAVEKAESKPSTPKKAKPGEISPLHTVRQLFPRDLEQLLNFAVEGAFIKIKPRQYLSAENFGKIAGIIRENGGEYVSAGKSSHFRIKVSDIKKE